MIVWAALGASMMAGALSISYPAAALPGAPASAATPVHSHGTSPQSLYRAGTYKGGEGDPTRTLQKVPGISSATALAASNSSNYVLLPNGTVMAFGDGRRGQLGDGTRTPSLRQPVQVTFPAGTVITAIGEGFDSGYAVDSTGHGWAWGGGAMCTHEHNTVLTPNEVPGLSNLVAVAGGGSHVLWLTSQGTVYACGSNSSGQLGDGRYQSTVGAVPVVGLPAGDPVAAISAGNNFSTALLADGEVWDWGQGDHGQLGDGATGFSPVPVRVQLPAGTYATEIYAGGDVTIDGHQLALLDNGEVVGWGAGTFGQLGDGQEANRDIPVPVSVPAGVTFSYVAAGGESSYAIDTTGGLWGWGANFDGQLNTPGTRPVLEPVEVDQGVGMVSATARDMIDFHP